jgi:hypothetical protein
MYYGTVTPQPGDKMNMKIPVDVRLLDKQLPVVLSNIFMKKSTGNLHCAKPHRLHRVLGQLLWRQVLLYPGPQLLLVLAFFSCRLATNACATNCSIAIQVRQLLLIVGSSWDIVIFLNIIVITVAPVLVISLLLFSLPGEHAALSSNSVGIINILVPALGHILVLAVLLGARGITPTGNVSEQSLPDLGVRQSLTRADINT